MKYVNVPIDILKWYKITLVKINLRMFINWLVLNLELSLISNVVVYNLSPYIGFKV